ncbi:peroxin 14/17, partial [Pyricularia oryzae Y34]
MADPDKKEDVPVPAWQQQQSNDGSTLDHARLFLQDEEVRQASREKKISFLRSKGVSGADIEILLGEDESSSITSDSNQTTAAAPHSAQEKPTASQPQLPPQPQMQQQQQPQQQTQPAQKPDQPPIVTYPEFLTKPPRPPPLITATTFLNTASAFAGLATLIIGTSKYVLSPMVESLTDARIDLHRSASDGLSRTIEKLEGIVSEVPPLPSASTQDKTGGAARKQDDNDAASSDGGDPTELFHRDVGVQTSPPQTPFAATASTQKPSAIESQATRLAKLTASVREMSVS